MPPKNMIWYRGHGKFYEYSNGKWIVIYDLSNNLSQEELDSVIDKIRNEGKELQDESLFGVLNTIVDSLSSGGSVTDVIKYIPQELTAEQKEQALTNIGAASQSSLVQVNNRAIDALSNSSSAANMAANAESKSNLAIQYVEAVPVTRGDGLNSVRQAGESSTSHPFSKGARSCAFGKLTTSLGDNSHTEGGSSNLAPDSITTSTSDEDIKSSWESKKFLMAKGQNAHAEGNNTLALANHAHAEGNQTVAEGQQSHTEGYLTETKNQSEHAEGRANKSNKANDTFGNAGNTIHSIGIGANTGSRKNAFEIMQNGDIYVFGLGGYDGTNIDTAKTLQQVIADITSQLN